MSLYAETSEHCNLTVLHEIGASIAASDPLDVVLGRVVELVSAVVKCDSCFVYVLEGSHLVLRASRNPHADALGIVKLRMGQGITGWVAQHKKPVAIERGAWRDPRWQLFGDLPEDSFEAFLSAPILCRGKLVGVINVQHREPHLHTQPEIHLISTIGFLVGPEIEMARQEAEDSRSSELAEARELVERAKLILKRDLNLDDEEAYLALEKQSRDRRKSIKTVAEAILITDEVKGLRKGN